MIYSFPMPMQPQKPVSIFHREYFKRMTWKGTKSWHPVIISKALYDRMNLAQRGVPQTGPSEWKWQFMLQICGTIYLLFCNHGNSSNTSTLRSKTTFYRINNENLDLIIIDSQTKQRQICIFVPANKNRFNFCWFYSVITMRYAHS